MLLHTNYISFHNHKIADIYATPIVWHFNEDLFAFSLFAIDTAVRGSLWKIVRRLLAVTCNRMSTSTWTCRRWWTAFSKFRHKIREAGRVILGNAHEKNDGHYEGLSISSLARKASRNSQLDIVAMCLWIKALTADMESANLVRAHQLTANRGVTQCYFLFLV